MWSISKKKSNFSKLRGKICFKYSRFEAKDSNIRILFGLQNSRIWIRIFKIRGKRFESESNPNIFDHLWYCFKSGYLGARTPQTHWLFLNMYEKWYTNVFGVISLRGPPRGPTFFLAPPEKMLKSTVFELEQWFLHQNGPFFHQEFNGKGLWVLGSQFCTKKMKNISEFQNSWNFWIFGSWTQPGAWHMIVPFWSWNLSDTTHVRSHTKFQLIWAINTAFTRGGAESAPPPHSNV